MRRIYKSNSYICDRSDIVAIYFSDVNKLSESYANSDESNLTPEQLIYKNLKYSVFVAKKYVHRGLELEDLIQLANIGLMWSAYHYDTSKGVKFISYATYLMQRLILNEINHNTLGIRVNKRWQYELGQIRNKIENCNQAYQKILTNEELRSLIPEINDLMYNIMSTTRAFSIDDFVKEDDNLTYENVLIQDNNIDKQYENEDLRQRVNDIMEKYLTDREKYIIKRIIYDSSSMDIIADELNICRERVRQLYHSALEKFRKHKQYLLDQ